MEALMTKITMLSKKDWEKTPGKWHGEFEGNVFGAGASVMFYATEEAGRGPRLHRHPYDEIFIVRKGRALLEMIDIHVSGTFIQEDLE